MTLCCLERDKTVRTAEKVCVVALEQDCSPVVSAWSLCLSVPSFLSVAEVCMMGWGAEW
jgi:hypothetical protein